MSDIPRTLRPKDWLVHLFSSRAAAEGGVVRRKTRDIERIVGREGFRDEIACRGFRAVENGGQTVVFCNREPLRMFR